jgi:CO/xanthine dehydrogenase Mo-binding subunit
MTATARAIGASARRSDGVAKVRGEAVYGIDYAEPWMLHAGVLRSPIPAGRITRLDVSRALELPGVHAIATWQDAPHLGGTVVKDQPVMAHDIVRYVGEPIAAVAADTLAQAHDAVAAIELEIDPLEPVTDVEVSMSEGTRLLHPEWESYAMPAPVERQGNVSWEVRLNRGDVDAAFESAHAIVEDEFRAPRQHTTPIEPHVAVARYEDGRYVITTPSQYPFLVRDRVAEWLGIRPSDVRVVVPTIGGGFGGKIDAVLEPIAAVLARKSGRPVRLANTRAEEHATVGPREDGIIRLRTAVSAEGDILGMQGEAILNDGAYRGEGSPMTEVPGILWGVTYRMPTARFRGRAVYTNITPSGAYRGVCGPFSIWALESHLDHIAQELDVDRRELRLRNLLREGDRMVNGQEVVDDGLAEGFERVEAIAPWAELARERRPLRGVGIAAVTWATNPSPGAASVKLNEDGTVTVISAAAEIGSGAVATGVRQVVAEELGMDVDDVMVTVPDTDAAAYDAGAQGSRTLHGVGAAALQAAESVREQVFEAASDMLEAAATDLEMADGHVSVVGSPSARVALAEVAETALWKSGPIVASGTFVAPPVPYDAGCMSSALFSTFSGATAHVHLAEVEVDPDTGKVTVLRYIVAQDVGRIINPQGIEGQINGGVLQGIGYALYEDLRIDAEGRVVDDNLETYRLPTALDAPPIEIVLMEQPCSFGPFGAKGAGEPPIVPAPAAIANAVADAVGTRFHKLPITPFDVLAALRGSATDERGPWHG